MHNLYDQYFLHNPFRNILVHSIRRSLTGNEIVTDTLEPLKANCWHVPGATHDIFGVKFQTA